MRRAFLSIAIIFGLGTGGSAAADDQAFVNPPPEARVRAYWWWLNGNVTKAAITRDLEEMAAKGIWRGADLRCGRSPAGRQ